MQNKLTKYHTCLDVLEKLAGGSKIQRLLHRPLPYIKGVLWSRLKYKWFHKSTLVQTQTFFNKKIQLILPSGLDIYLLGTKTHDSEIRLCRFMLNQLKKGDIFIDIGTHFGFYSLLASELTGKEGHVIGIEASPQIFKTYQKNVSPHSNITPFNLAATESNQELTFYEFPVLFSEYNTIDISQFENDEWLAKNGAEKVRVQGKKMDDLLLNQLNIQAGFIKIDVEGAELEVIKGLTKTLSQAAPAAPIIAMEFLTDNNHTNETSTQTQSPHQQAALLLKNLNYDVFAIDPKGQLLPLIYENIHAHITQKGLDSDNVVFVKTK